jgi:tRNA (guanine-N7-)-methyltransferase
VGKNKLIRFQENTTFPHMIQPRMVYPFSDHELKGHWRNLFFKNDNPIILELGCGRGEYTIDLALRYPDKNYIGVDKKGARLWRGAKTSHLDQIANTAFIRTQIQLIPYFFSEKEIDEIWITFPDPHPARSSERRRLTSKRFLEVYKRLLKPRGTIHLKTDNEGLYQFTLAEAEKYNVHFHTHDLYGMAKDQLPQEVFSVQTTYEKRFLAEEKKICYLSFSFND